MPSYNRQRGALTLALLLVMAAPAQGGDAVAVAAPQAAAPQDYYTRRAREILKQDETANAIAPHPLAAAYPNHSVVVCEAGCPSERGAEVVFMESSRAAQASGAGAKAARVPTIDCVGGCYDTPRRYEAAQSMSAIPTRPGQPTHTSNNREPFDPRY